MKWIRPILFAASTIIVVAVSIWSIEQIRTEGEYIRMEIDSSASAWFENYYIEMEVLNRLFSAADYDGTDFTEFISDAHDEILSFWDSFSLHPGILDGVLIIEKADGDSGSIFLDADQKRIFYGYPEYLDAYLDYCRLEQFFDSYTGFSFPVFAPAEGLSRPFMYYAEGAREVLIMLDYEQWRFRLPEILDSTVPGRNEDLKSIFSIRITEGNQDLADYYLHDDPAESFPMTLMSFGTGDPELASTADWNIPNDYLEDDGLAYAVGSRARLQNSSLLNEDGFYGDITGVEIIGRGVWGTLEIDEKALNFKAVRVRLGGLFLAYTASVVFIIFLFILERYNRRTAVLLKEQQSFIANVSHELRTPLAVICNAGRNLEQGFVEDGEPVMKYGKLISDQGRRLSSMVEAVLMYSGFQLGHVKKELLRLEPLLQDLLKPYLFLCEQDNIELVYDVRPDLVVAADRQGLSAAVGNLLRNAVVHGGRDGRICLSAGPSGDGGYIEVSVEDHGPGIEKNEQKKIFQPFVRGERAGRLAVPGSGLGLNLVKKVAELHGGSIELRSVPGEGAKFTLKLPVAEDRDGE